jgi:hypothetical protein
MSLYKAGEVTPADGVAQETISDDTGGYIGKAWAVQEARVLSVFGEERLFASPRRLPCLAGG